MAYDSIFKPGLFAGQTVIVTGGGSGIGRCTAHELAALGAHVVLVGRKAEKLEKTAGEIVEDGGSASWHSCDIRDEEAVKALVAQVLAERGPVHHLVNNAGGQYPAPLASINLKGFEAVVRTNLVGGFLMAREVFNQSMSKHGGSIVNMLADMWGGMPGMGHSGAARAGMENFTKTAAFEWGHCNVRVNAVSPGAVVSEAENRVFANRLQQYNDWIIENQCLKQRIEARDVADLVVFLASERSRMITGQNIQVDGGW